MFRIYFTFTNSRLYKQKKKNLIINLDWEDIVLDIIKKVQEVSNVPIRYDFKDRRSGDTDIVTASSELAKKSISWEPRDSDLETIIKSTLSVYKSIKS